MAKGAPSTKNETALFLPGPEFWELWKTNGSGKFRRDETTAMHSASPEKVPSGVRFSYPVSAAFAVPFWASTNDPALLEDVGDMQLEKLGLKPPGAMGKLREFNVVDQVGNRSLAVATVLAPHPGTRFSRTPPDSFQVSPFHYKLPSDSVVVWRELGRLVMAVTRNDAPVYFAALSATAIDAAAMQEIRCILLQLGTQEAIPGIDQVVLWLGARRDNEAAELIRSQLGVPAVFADPPPPELPAHESTLVPEEVALARYQSAQRRRWRNRLVVAGFVYLALIGVFVGRLLLTQREADGLKAEIAKDSPQSEAIRQTQMQWESLRLAVDVSTYPTEMLLRMVNVLPPRGVRLTQFQLTEDSIFLKGEASSAPEAIKFKGVLTNDPAFADYEWNFPPPVIVPNMGATFQTKGTLRYAVSQN